MATSDGETENCLHHGSAGAGKQIPEIVVWFAMRFVANVASLPSLRQEIVSPAKLKHVASFSFALGDPRTVTQSPMKMESTQTGNEPNWKTLQ